MVFKEPTQPSAYKEELLLQPRIVNWGGIRSVVQTQAGMIVVEVVVMA